MKMENEVRLVERKDCPMRHPDNGNCTVAGGFCTAVNDPICDALHNAYDCGRRSIDPDSLRPKGRWIKYENGVIVCSECGEEHEWEDYRASYCEDCGAKMEG